MSRRDCCAPGRASCLGCTVEDAAVQAASAISFSIATIQVRCCPGRFRKTGLGVEASFKWQALISLKNRLLCLISEAGPRLNSSRDRAGQACVEASSHEGQNICSGWSNASYLQDNTGQAEIRRVSAFAEPGETIPLSLKGRKNKSNIIPISCANGRFGL